MSERRKVLGLLGAGMKGAYPAAPRTAEEHESWVLVSEELPPEGVEIEVVNGDRVERLVYDSGLWWLSDRSMYVYYVPKLWRLIQDDAT